MLDRAENYAMDLMQRFRPQALWGGAAAIALLVAVLSSQSDVGAQKAADALASMSFGLVRPSHVPPPAFDAEAATRLLARAVQDLKTDHDRTTARLATLERDMADMTGSISQEIEAARTASAQAPPWPTGEGPAVAETSATIAAMLAAPPAASATSTPDVAPAAISPPAASPTLSPPAESAPAAHPPAYGADIGSAGSIKTLQTRWTALRAAHWQLFERLHPSVTLRDNRRSSRTELRLVVGPFANAEEAARLCAALATFKQACQPTMFDGQLALHAAPAHSARASVASERHDP